MNEKKNFYDFNLDSLTERRERNSLYPELAKFHIALREELGDAEYQEFFNAEKESYRQFALKNQPMQQRRI